jgi:hypothetical protein
MRIWQFNHLASISLFYRFVPFFSLILVIGGRQKIRQSQPPLAELIKPFLTERKSRWAKARTTTRVKFFFYFQCFIFISTIPPPIGQKD